MENLRNEFQKLSVYTRLPSRLEKMYPEIAAQQRDDKTGSLDRLEAIKVVLGDRNLGKVVDLAGNSGYFCLSLIDAGMIERATVYDMASDALSAGRIMARQMAVDDRIEFVEQKIDLDFLRSLPRVDTMFCLYLLHHAGTLFDLVRVEAKGWERYAEDWLSEMRHKCRLAVVAVGFKATRPPHWNAPRALRPARFGQMAERAGWRILYDGNVQDIRTLGVEAANGRYTKGGQLLNRGSGPLTRMIEKLARRARIIPPQKHSTDRRGVYHLYILENPDQLQDDATGIAESQGTCETTRLLIGHLLVVTGASGAGKSTFVEQMLSGTLREDVAAQLPVEAKNWTRVKAGDCKAFFAAAPHNQEQIPGLMLDYDMSRKVARRDGYENDPAMQLLLAAGKITVVNLRPSVDRMVRQLVRRDSGVLTANMDNIEMEKLRWRVARLARAVLSPLAKTIPHKLVGQLKRSSTLSQAWGGLQVQRSLLRKLRRYQHEGWLDEIYRHWQAHLDTLAAKGKTIEQIYLEPEAGAQVGTGYHWRHVSAAATAPRAEQ